MARTVGSNVGFARSDAQLFTIPSGATGAAVTPLDFGRGYAMYVVKVVSTANIQAATGLSLKVSYAAGDAEVDLFNSDDPTTKWSKSPLPTGANSLGFVLTTAFGAQKLRFILSQNSGGGGSVIFEVYGVDPTVDDD